MISFPPRLEKLKAQSDFFKGALESAVYIESRYV